MGFFSKDTSYLGVDIGSYNVKVVEFKKDKNRPVLITYGFSDRLVGSQEPKLLADLDKAAEVLKQVCQRAKVTTKTAIAALPTAEVFTSIINLTSVKFLQPAETKQALKREAAKVIPLALEKTILHYYPLSKKGKKEDINGQTSVNRWLLTAAPKELVEKYLTLFKKSGLVNAGLETEGFALRRALIGNDKSVNMIVDLGEVSAGLLVIDNGLPILKRSIDLAGYNFTKIISRQLKINWLEAEQFKRDLSNLEQINKIAAFQELLGNLVHEIKYCFDLYQQKGAAEQEKIEKIILTGGLAILPGLADYLSKELDLRVFLGDPWARVVYPEELRLVLDNIGPKMSLAIGLALRGIE